MLYPIGKRSVLHPYSETIEGMPRLRDTSPEMALRS
jgi:hypothetical protein